MNILVGADPELFVKDGEKFISARGMIEGDKDNPSPVENGAVQVDGMALEFNINPAKNLEEFEFYLDSVMTQLKALISPQYDVVVAPTAHFDEDYMKKQPMEALELGCLPDYNAYTGQPNPTPKSNVNFRTGAGHIHIGWTDDVDPMHPEHFKACRLLTKRLDLVLGVPSLLWDKDKERLSLYGKAGAFRPKPYGCEYRVLSNMWLTDERLIKYVYKNVIKAFKHLVKSGGNIGQHGYVHTRHCQGVINESDMETAAAQEYYTNGLAVEEWYVRR